MDLSRRMYPQGRMLHHFRELCVGDYLAVKGPKGRFRYQPGQVRAFGMIAGGSGITPMFQILPKCLRTGLVCKLDASHLNRGKDSQGEEVIKPYTPTTLDSDVGHFELVIKVARAILENPKDMTNVHLIYANVTYEDILLKEELDSLVANYPGRFKVHYVLNQEQRSFIGI
ncbi:hypothetical protein GOBAR_AA33000 [Gossypium barbadense]|uniref:Oxidoreductase FAD/NAD(P)-binding domain-containing protein n=1 Tax=Gossypium barbadense TaxID=3634 RepID=A0A2P5W9C4_GOSBA|nr:hypothetical protein GOBAR_AA33000 [Gossypium barbadense]